ncbi:uncharacterized protein V6R79_008555 [Siganus canaliculatus]
MTTHSATCVKKAETSFHSKPGRCLTVVAVAVEMCRSVTDHAVFHISSPALHSDSPQVSFRQKGRMQDRLASVSLFGEYFGFGD